MENKILIDDEDLTISRTLYLQSSLDGKQDLINDDDLKFLKFKIFNLH
jgi:hypothetical protein